MKKLGVLAVLLTLGLGANMSVAQPAKKLRPTIASASVPLDPRVIRAARLQGDVTFRLGGPLSTSTAEVRSPFVDPGTEIDV
jgi:hypothetical protein